MNHGLSGAIDLGVAHELDAPVGQVLREVVAVRRAAGRSTSGCRRRGPDTTGGSRRRGSRRSARTRGRAASGPATRTCRSSAGRQVPLADAYVFQPRSLRTSAIVPVLDGIRAEKPGKPAPPSVMTAMLLASRCGRSAGSTGSASTARWCGSWRTAGRVSARRRSVGRLDRAAEDVDGAEADVVPDDHQDVRRPVGAFGWRTGVQSGHGVPDVEVHHTVELLRHVTPPRSISC